MVLPIVLLESQEYAPDPTYLSLWNFYEFGGTIEFHKHYMGENIFLFSKDKIIGFKEDESENPTSVHKIMSLVDLHFKLDDQFATKPVGKKIKI